MRKSDIVLALEPVVKCFDELRILYYVGGSIASSAYGMARATADVDLVTNLQTAQVEKLVTVLKSDFFVDEQMILDAIKTKSSFNIIHLSSGIKIDVFLLHDNEYSKQTVERIKKDTINDGIGEIEIYLCSAEDIIINKLLWYKKGNMISEKQWLDIIGVIKVQSSVLDSKYLRLWAEKMDIQNLLEKAFLESEHDKE